MRFVNLFILFCFVLELVAPVDFRSGVYVLTILVLFVYVLISKLNSSSAFLDVEIGGRDTFFLTRNNVLFLIILSLLLANYSSTFYTGMSLIASTKNLFSATSNYKIYQVFFSENNLNVFSFAKIPVILAVSVVKLICLIGVYITTVVRKNMILGYLCIIPYLLLSVSRGTSFEIFEIFVALLSFKIFFSPHKKVVNVKSLVIGLVFAFLFLSNIEARLPSLFEDLEVVCYTNELCFDKTSLVYGISKSLSAILYYLTGYFSFGYHYAFFYFLKIIEQSEYLNLLFGTWKFESSSRFVCSSIDCGVNWEPDIIYFIYNYGLILFFVVLFLLVSFHYRLVRLRIKLNRVTLFLCTVLNFYIVLQLLSFPVGNFLRVSTPNIVIIIFIIISVSIRYVRKSFYN